MEVIGLLLTVLGLIFLFETPRQWVADLFTQKSSNDNVPILSNNEPLSPHSLLLYVSSSSRAAALDQTIADQSKTAPAPFTGDGMSLYEKIKALEIATIGELDDLVRNHAEDARALAHAFTASKEVESSYGLELVIEIEAIRRYGCDWYYRFLEPLRLTSASKGYASDLHKFYEAIRRARVK